MLILSKTYKWFLGVSWTTTSPHCFLFDVAILISQPNIFKGDHFHFLCIPSQKNFVLTNISQNCVCVCVTPMHIWIQGAVNKTKNKKPWIWEKNGVETIYTYIHNTTYTTPMCVFGCTHDMCVYTYTCAYTTLGGSVLYRELRSEPSAHHGTQHRSVQVSLC